MKKSIVLVSLILYIVGISVVTIGLFSSGDKLLKMVGLAFIPSLVVSIFVFDIVWKNKIQIVQFRKTNDEDNTEDI